MGIRTILTLGYIFISTSLFAGVVDSVGVENLNGKKVIIHKVAPKDSYYSISRRYNVTPRAVIDFNQNRPLHPGVDVKVPTDADFAQPEPKKNKISAFISRLSPSGNKQQDIVEYKVGPKETLYAIAKRFNTTVDDIKKLNNLKSDALVVGRILKIRYGVKSPADPPAQPVVSPVAGRHNDSTIIDSSGNASDRLKLPAIRYGLREVTERGVAATIHDDGMDNSRMLALHRTAPVGTIIKITNPMTNKTTFAKVIGKISDNEITRDAIIVVNKSTADLIGAVDQRFQVTLVYGEPNGQ